MLSLSDFQKISLEDKPIFQKYYERYPPHHSGNLFTTLISWNEYADYRYTQMNDHIVIMQQIKNDIQFRLPFGLFNRDLVQQVLTLARKEGASAPVGLIEKQQKEELLQEYPHLRCIENRDLFDYVYLASDLADLPGTKYAKIRNRLNKFNKNYVYTIEPISNENMGEVRNFLKRWCLWKDCKSDELLETEHKAIIYAMSHFIDLDLSGLALRIKDTIEAVSVFEKMNHDTAVVHFEKGSPEYDGIYKAINMETAKLLQNTVTYLDREEDMGIPGLRKAKMSYNPHHMVEVFHILRESIDL